MGKQFVVFLFKSLGVHQRHDLSNPRLGLLKFKEVFDTVWSWEA